MNLICHKDENMLRQQLQMGTSETGPQEKTVLSITDLVSAQHQRKNSPRADSKWSPFSFFLLLLAAVFRVLPQRIVCLHRTPPLFHQPAPHPLSRDTTQCLCALRLQYHFVHNLHSLSSKCPNLTLCFLTNLPVLWLMKPSLVYPGSVPAVKLASMTSMHS